jgi:hypothetical protein
LEIPIFTFRDFISSEEMKNLILSSARLRSSASPSSYFTCSSCRYSYQSLGVAHFLIQTMLSGKELKYRGKNWKSKPYPIKPVKT